MKIILLGATGLVGSEILKLLKNSQHEVLIPTRRKIENISSNMVQEINSSIPTALKTLDENSKAQVIICALGSTIKKAKTQENFIKIDKELPLEIFKEYSKHTKVILISALGAKSSSKIFYNRVKGELEDELIALKFKKTHIIKPSLIIGQRNEYRALEKLSQNLLKNINHFTPKSLHKYTVHKATLIAKTTIDLLNEDHSENLIMIESYSHD